MNKQQIRRISDGVLDKLGITKRVDVTCPECGFVQSTSNEEPGLIWCCAWCGAGPMKVRATIRKA